MKVLHILNELKYSGAETMLTSAASIWGKNGVELHVLSTGKKSGAYTGELRKSGYSLHHIPFEKNLKFVKKVRDLCRNENFDLVHIHPEGIYLQCALATFWAGIPSIRTVHHIFAYKGWRYYRTILMRHFCRFFLKVKFVSNSFSGKSNELKMYYMDNEYIPNWFNSDIYNIETTAEARHKIPEIRKELGANENSKILISLGGNWEYKNYDKVIKAISRTSDSNNYIYVHCGGDESGELSKLADKLNVKYVGKGFVKDVIPYLVTADLFMQPSREEGFCIAAVEAMATGIPVCFSTRPALCDFKNYCDEIFWCEPETKSITKVLEHFQTITDERKKIISESIMKASNNFCIERGASAYYDLYKRVVK
jgi:glycosyltransferase involved in cell wall biosynthesis